MRAASFTARVSFRSILARALKIQFLKRCSYQIFAIDQVGAGGVVMTSTSWLFE